MRHFLIVSSLASLFLGCATAPAAKHDESLKQVVFETERAFARSMAERDFGAFTSFLSEEAVFFSGDTATRGKANVAAQWEAYFLEARAPFSWEPNQVEVLSSGDLALSSGPVYDPEGKQVATFTSVWKQEEPGVWRIIFDKGSLYCPPSAPDH